MSRSGYSDEFSGEGNEIFLYRAAVDRAIGGKRGQKMFREMLAALDAMPEKRLISSALVNPDGVCALGCLGQARGIDMRGLEVPVGDDEYANADDWRPLAGAFDIAVSLAREVAFMNDESWFMGDLTPEARWTRMRAWVANQIVAPKEAVA